METESEIVLGALSTLFILINSFSVEAIIGLLGIVVLLVLSALISGSEVAYFSINNNDWKQLNSEESVSSQLIVQMIEKPRTLLATILISNNFINVAIVILSSFLQARFLPDAVFNSWATSICRVLNYTDQLTIDWVSYLLGTSITVVGVTALLVLFGEIAPKVYARQNNIGLARLMARPLRILMRIFSPFSFLLVSWTRDLEGRLHSRTIAGNVTSREDIDEAINLTVNLGEHSAKETDLLKRIIKFGDVAAKQIMRSRVDVVAVDFRLNYHELLQTVRQSNFSRIPVYDDDFDNVTGILYVKDLLGHLGEQKDFEWQALIRPDVLYVPEAKKIDDLLRDFQKEHMHMAIVVDEYGGSSGIVTMEDILEEVLGEIKDEFDDEIEVIYRQLDAYNFLFEGKTLLNDVCRIIGVDTTTFDEVRGDSDTVAGLVLELIGEIPKKETEVKYNDYNFKIVQVSKRRIVQVLITLPKKLV
ncbi:MAG: gliding motility-associated protein GldE [Saprospiraceae bacterium]|nr:gliding motility-associated protein GldE [Saprospiraceae bacterium]